ncbi:MAG TPA: DUF5666 domain-containing protein [Ktedonobacteraceae bacterium]
MRKLSTKKMLLLATTLVLALAAFLAGGIAISSVQAASTGAQSKSAAQSGCDTKNADCKKGGPGTARQIKAIVTITSVSGNTIQATIVAPTEKKGNLLTIMTTSTTTYKPDRSIVAAGTTVFLAGTVNSDGSVTAQMVGFYDPTAGTASGVITSMTASTVTVRAKDTTLTIRLTDSTTFFKAAGKAGDKKTNPASGGDLKVGEIIQASGKLNADGSLTAATVSIWSDAATSK